MVRRLEEDELFPFRTSSNRGSKDEGEFRRLKAPGQPHWACSVRRVDDSGEV